MATSSPQPRQLSDADRATLAILASPLLAGAPDTGESREALAQRCDARLTRLPLDRRRALSQAIGLCGSRVGVLLALGTPSRFAALSPAQQAACVQGWIDSPIPLVRAAIQTIRKLVLSVHYAHPEAVQGTGFAGPLHTRSPGVAWEGPLPERATDPASDAESAGDDGRQAVARGSSRPLRVLPDVGAPDGVIVPTAVTAPVARRADAVVIGSGAGGAVAAARLAEAGLEVVILESGAWFAPAEFTGDEPALMDRLYADGALRTTDDGSVALIQGDAVGGSTLVNWMIMLRTPPWVLEQWAMESGVEGMLPAEMAPVFDRIEREVHAGIVPEEAHSANNRIVLDGARALGWRVQGARINARHCLRCGECGIGCRHEAKQSTTLTFLPRALAAGARLYSSARVERIERRERDQGSARQGTPPLKRVHATVNGQAVTIDAPLVVVAGGAIGTPVLLQRSGLGGGGVGSWLRLHPTTGVMGFYEREIVSSTGIPLTTMCNEFIRWQDTDYGFWIETPPMLPSFTAAAMPGFGAAHARQMARFNQLGVLVGLTRDGAERDRSSGRVRVSRNGAVSIRYRLTVEDERRVQASLAAMARLHFANGARAVETMHGTPRTIRRPEEADQLATLSVAPNRMALFSAHVNGTCRLGTDPDRSGATPDGERHGVRGLYISDGSVLPTALGVNPQETIMAVSTVLSERMVSRHRGVTGA